MKPTFEHTLENLKKFDTNLSKACIAEMQADTARFKPGIKGEYDQLRMLYETRLKIAQTINADKFTELELKSWEVAMKLLRQRKSQNLLLSIVWGEAKIYLIFWDAEKFIISAMFYLSRKTSIEEK